MFRVILILFLFNILILANTIKAKYGGTLVFAKIGDTVTFDAARVSDGETTIACQSIFETLVTFKYGTTILIPALAKSWDISNNGLEYVFHLRKGVYFHKTKFFNKSSEFTADDVLFTFKRQYDKSHPFHKIKGKYVYWNAMNMSEIIKDIIKIDKYTVKFILKQNNAPFLYNLTMNFTAILSSDFANHLLKINKKEDINKYPIGTGAFSLLKWIKNNKIIYKRNENYWRGKAYVERLIFKIIPNSTIRTSELKKGSIHIMDFPNPKDLKSLSENKNIKIIEQEGFNVAYLAMNTKKYPFTKLKVRQAINYAINKKAILDNLYAGLGKVAKNPIPPTLWSYNNDIIDYEYNPNKAKKLLKEAGLNNGFETTLWAMPVARAYNPNARNVAIAIQADLLKVGIKVKIITYTWGTYLEKTKMGEHDMALLGWSGDNGDPDNFLYTLLSKSAAKKPATNIAFWENDEFDMLVTKARKTSDINKRTKYYREAQVIFKREAPWVTIAHSLVKEAIRKNIYGFKLSPISNKIFNYVWIDKSDSKE